MFWDLRVFPDNNFFLWKKQRLLSSLWKGHGIFSLLDCQVAYFSVKTSCGWPQKCFTEILEGPRVKQQQKPSEFSGGSGIDSQSSFFREDHFESKLVLKSSSFVETIITIVFIVHNAFVSTPLCVCAAIIFTFLQAKTPQRVEWPILLACQS